ncbi:uncharacterized protein Z518_03264 [Rhinocladiella mackenziei CBS 650.93]|uniref:Uncharacterized protein n=1 Tax=Rhinocladiella mackenziei CBS 650.93 TaxID=1442369 RepID=A0A0D2HDK1_9EURO|nr:uncharacterized protein Z518_03264 [Rhinocladiella mackenziei CBS 650.93]KIX08608.1 hypothetical protein Z518_03264 [Rhinocladiella mackenziei CBS 650.93]
MPPEIADSDAESDLISPVKQSIIQNGGVETAANPSQFSLTGYDFGQYLDPNQRLSSLSPRIDNGVEGISEGYANHPNRTSEHLDESALNNAPIRAGEISPAVRSKKRAHSTLQDTSNNLGTDIAEEFSKPKRSKTYGSSRSRAVEDIDLSAMPVDVTPEVGKFDSARPTRSQRDHSVSNVGQSSTEMQLHGSTTLRHSNSGIGLTGQSLSDATHRLTTTVASMGRYESITLDFRGSGQGLDITANPFGSLSQVSLDEDPKPAETERFVSMFRPHDDLLNLENANHSLVSNETPQHLPLSALSQSSPDRPSAVDPSRLMWNDGATLETAAGGELQEGATTTNRPDTDGPSESVLTNPDQIQPEKGGRKAKNSRIPSLSPAPGVVEDFGDLALANLPRPDGSRQGTIDPVSQASQASAINNTTKKRKRRKSKQGVEEEDSAIKPIETSPVKQPTSELNLGDEALIGLPKESYKPRPSRSRSKKMVEEETTIFPPSLSETEHDTSATQKNAGLPEPQEHTLSAGPSKTGAKKSGRKSKVKRAKTSAAALLKKADPMISEGEEDVVWMDAKPAPVKLDLPPDVKVLKEEAEIPEEEGREVEASNTHLKGDNANNSKITIGIPPAAETKDVKSEPKKRGRKPKKVQQKPEQESDEAEEDPDLNARPALTEKSPNMADVVQQAPADADSRGPTTTPAPSSPEAPPDQKYPEKENATASITTPSKLSPPPKKGPTKHSPISSLAGSNGKKIIYRIGLSRRQNIPSLLRKVQRDKPPPKIVIRKEKENKKNKEVVGDGDFDGEDENGDGEGGSRGELRGPDGMLTEWDD